MSVVPPAGLEPAALRLEGGRTTSSSLREPVSHVAVRFFEPPEPTLQFSRATNYFPREQLHCVTRIPSRDARTPYRGVAASARPQVADSGVIPGVFVGRLKMGLREVVPSDWVLGLAIRDEMSRVRHGHAADHLAGSRHVALDLLRRETTAKVGIAMKRPMAGWDNACIRTELGILMRLLGPLSHGLDATRARCYKSAHSIPESWRDN